MKEQILQHLDNPHQLEKLYRDNKSSFKKEFNQLYPEIRGHSSAQIWHERLNYEGEGISWGANFELTFVIIASLLAGILFKIPEFTPIESEFFFSRNTAFIFFPILAAYFAWKQKLHPKKLLAISSIFLLSCVYVNSLPDVLHSDTIHLVCIHLPLFLWAILGYSYIGNNQKDTLKRLEYLRYNGDLMVMTTIILIAGMILSMVTFGLFSLIDVSIQEFYKQYVLVFGLAASPIIGTYLVQTNPQLVNKVSPVIAKVFTPLVFLTLIAYLVAIFGADKDPYSNRDFLLIFNLLLVGVLAIILFSVAETSQKMSGKIGEWILFGLALITIVINGIALSAIIFRISEWGISPNKLAVLGGNIIILINLLVVTYRMFQSLQDSSHKENIERSITSYLPVYSAWTFVVTFIFPILFNFK